LECAHRATPASDTVSICRLRWPGLAAERRHEQSSARSRSPSRPIRRSARRERTQNDVPERDGFRTDLVRMRGVVVGPGERIITGPLRPHTGTGRRPGPSILGSTWSTRGR
jgi:hypothetical protein